MVVGGSQFANKTGKPGIFIPALRLFVLAQLSLCSTVINRYAMRLNLTD